MHIIKKPADCIDYEKTPCHMSRIASHAHMVFARRRLPWKQEIIYNGNRILTTQNVYARNANQNLLMHCGAKSLVSLDELVENTLLIQRLSNQ